MSFKLLPRTSVIGGKAKRCDNLLYCIRKLVVAWIREEGTPYIVWSRIHGSQAFRCLKSTTLAEAPKFDYVEWAVLAVNRHND